MSSPRPLRIVHVVATPTGAPWMVAMLREQRRLGHDVAAIIPSLDGTIAAQLGADGIACYAADVDVLFTSSLVGKAITLLRFIRLLRRLRPDVVHSHIINSVVTARLAAWIADVPIHLGGNVHPFSVESEVLREIEIGTAFCDTVTIASCEYTRDLFLQFGLRPNRIALIHYAVDQSRHDPALADPARVRTEFGIAAGTPVIGKVAYFYPPSNTRGMFPSHVQGRGVKGHEVLIRAIPHVLEAEPDARFVLVGRGWGPSGPKYEAELKDLVKSLGVSDSVLFPGERKDVPDVLAAFDISVHCSLSDNLGGTVESLLMERPLIVSDNPGFADAVIHDETGLVVPAGDAASLADAIVTLIRDRERGRRLGRRGRQHVLERFTLVQTVAKLEALLARLPARAEGRYRFMVSAGRLFGLPFRLLPVMIRTYGAMRRHGHSVVRLIARRARHALWRAVHVIFPRGIKAAFRT